MLLNCAWELCNAASSLQLALFVIYFLNRAFVTYGNSEHVFRVDRNFWKIPFHFFEYIPRGKCVENKIRMWRGFSPLNPDCLRLFSFVCAHCRLVYSRTSVCVCVVQLTVINVRGIESRFKQFYATHSTTRRNSKLNNYALHMVYKFAGEDK